MDADLAKIRFHALTGVKKGDSIHGWTRERGEMVILVTANVSDVAVISGSLDIPGSVLEKLWSISTTEGVSTSWTANHSVFTSTMVGRCQSQTSLVKASTVPSSEVAHVNYGVTYCAPQRFLM